MMDHWYYIMPFIMEELISSLTLWDCNNFLIVTYSIFKVWHKILHPDLTEYM